MTKDYNAYMKMTFKEASEKKSKFAYLLAYL